METKKPKLSMTGAIVLLSFCIVYASLNISSAIRESSRNHVNTGFYDYEIGRFNDNFEELIKTLQENTE
ncbi:hypothetical protein N0O92_13540 [Alkalihalobacillus sp. MEB130]|uniref:hypothetical protein n=1 Tax=Alkalihalobacillus sp. MEB130 TaxID=2976704 RepID=UPI0028DF2DEF|nr:hypothetical protein [Alkalihalobacillus sp. MEB130]MDT8861259.1 hypothetical protein [Alkalihalobacillus sp. MEB130]